jgi:hypothetical protein
LATEDLMAKGRASSLGEKALASAEQHGRSLKAVNAKLADLVASLRDQKERLLVYTRTGAPRTTGEEEVHMDPGSMDATEAAELALARVALQQKEEEQARLRERLAEIELENRRVCDEFVAVQEQNVGLVGLYAAIERLHGAPTRGDVLVAIQEIVINLIGSEELALFELTSDGRRLVPALAFGIEEDALEEIPVGSGTVGRTVAEGKAYVAGEDAPPGRPEDRQLTACIPLKFEDKATGALAIYGLLAHKHALTDLDHGIFSLLERHAGLALHLRTPERPTGAR